MQSSAKRVYFKLISILLRRLKSNFEAYNEYAENPIPIAIGIKTLLMLKTDLIFGEDVCTIFN
jgi:hypothetical protein